MHTAAVFNNLLTGVNVPDPEFTKDYLPAWDQMDRIASSTVSRVSFGLLYTAFYVVFAPSAWWYLLLPVHFVMGPVQGAIVNWCGHKYGYSNYNNGDHSKNSTPFGLFMMGELFQNNHHYNKDNANFARKWFEFDTTYIIMKGLHRMKIIRLLPLPISSKK